MMEYEVTRVVDADGSVYWHEDHLTREEVDDLIGPQADFAHFIARRPE